MGLGIKLGAVASGQANLILTQVANAYDPTTLNNFSFSGVNFGPAGTNRLIIVCCTNDSNPAQGISGMTIGGVSATLAAGVANTFYSTFIFYALVPTGTSGTIAFTSPSNGSSIVVYSLTGQTSNTPYFASAITSGTPRTATQTINARSATLASFSGSVSGTPTWGGTAGVVNDFNRNPSDSAGFSQHTTAKLVNSTALGSVTITNNLGGTGELCVAGWQ